MFIQIEFTHHRIIISFKYRYSQFVNTDSRQIDFLLHFHIVQPGILFFNVGDYLTRNRRKHVKMLILNNVELIPMNIIVLCITRQVFTSLMLILYEKCHYIFYRGETDYEFLM